MSAKLDEVLALLRSIDAGIKQLNAKRPAKKDRTQFFDTSGPAGPNPCITCHFRETCKSARADLDKWNAHTGGNAKPGVTWKKFKVAA